MFPNGEQSPKPNVKHAREFRFPGCSQLGPALWKSKNKWLGFQNRAASWRTDVNSNLVDSASSHTLVSKIKPCMSKYKRLYTVKLRTAH